MESFWTSGKNNNRERGQRDTRIDDQPAMSGEPEDHAVTSCRDESLREKDGHSPEYRTVVLATTGTAGAVDESRRPERETEHVVVNYSAEVPEHLPRTNDHEVAQAE